MQLTLTCIVDAPPARLAAYVFGAVFLSLCVPTPGMAEPPAITKRTTTWTGIPLSTLVKIDLKGVLLEVPMGYFHDWPRGDVLGKVNHQFTALDIHFWMPSKRYPELSGVSTPGFRPTEKNREYDPSAYIVKATVEVQNVNDPKYVTSEKGFRNLTLWPSRDAYKLFQEPFGLIRFWRDGVPSNAPIWYKSVEGVAPQILLRCTPPHG